MMPYGGAPVKTVAAIVGVALAAACTDPPPTARHVRRAEVLVIRDFDEMRFTNDSSFDLLDCRVSIDGGFLGRLASLPSRGRGSIARRAFSNAPPRDEFYRRSMTAEMGCHDSDGGFVEVVFK